MPHDILYGINVPLGYTAMGRYNTEHEAKRYAKHLSQRHASQTKTIKAKSGNYNYVVIEKRN